MTRHMNEALESGTLSGMTTGHVLMALDAREDSVYQFI